MKHYEINSKWALVMTFIITGLCMVGGYFERGYFTFDGGCVLGILLLIVVAALRQSESDREGGQQ